MPRLRVYVAIVMAAALSAVMLVSSPAAASDPHVIPIDPATTDDPEALRILYAPPPRDRSALDPTQVARCGTAAPNPVPNGEPIVVSMPPAPTFTVGQIPASWWRTPPVADPTWQLNFRGLIWLKPLAVRAAQDDQAQSLQVLIDQYVAFYGQNPDPGSTAYGWDEATATYRLGTATCLYALTRSDRLIAGMHADAAVVLGPRYSGPPIHPVHNHGLMSNLALIYAADLINEPGWKSTAVARMTAEAPQAFSALGISHEQSSMYHEGNLVLWESAATVLEQTPGSEGAAQQVRGIVARGWTMFAWMTEPDGNIVQIGDSDEGAGRAGDFTPARVLRDDQTGWIMGRWAWTDPNTSYYTIRYGPGRRAHGQHDRAGGVTWSTRGIRVLVGPGRYNYDGTNPYHAYQYSPQSHNVAIPDGGSVQGSAYASITASKVQAPAHAWGTSDTVYGIRHTRNINVNRDLFRLVVVRRLPHRLPVAASLAPRPAVAAHLWRRKRHHPHVHPPVRPDPDRDNHRPCLLGAHRCHPTRSWLALPPLRRAPLGLRDHHPVVRAGQHHHIRRELTTAP